MATLAAMTEETTSDPTFRHYDQVKAQSYANHRGSYSSKLYDTILDYHREVGNGRFDALLDVGCGPGNSTRDLAQQFERAYAVDPGAELIQSAKKLGGTSRNSSPIVFAVAPAEDFAKQPEIPRYDINIDGSGVDMITAGMAVSTYARGVSREAVMTLT